MRNIFVFRKNDKYNVRFDYYSYFAYRYHRLFFRSLFFVDANCELLIFLLD